MRHVASTLSFPFRFAPLSTSKPAQRSGRAALAAAATAGGPAPSPSISASVMAAAGSRSMADPTAMRLREKRIARERRGREPTSALPDPGPRLLLLPAAEPTAEPAAAPAPAVLGISSQTVLTCETCRRRRWYHHHRRLSSRRRQRRSELATGDSLDTACILALRAVEGLSQKKAQGRLCDGCRLTSASGIASTSTSASGRAKPRNCLVPMTRFSCQELRRRKGQCDQGRRAEVFFFACVLLLLFLAWRDVVRWVRKGGLKKQEDECISWSVS